MLLPLPWTSGTDRICNHCIIVAVSVPGNPYAPPAKWCASALQQATASQANGRPCCCLCMLEDMFGISKASPCKHKRKRARQHSKYKHAQGPLRKRARRQRTSRRYKRAHTDRPLSWRAAGSSAPRSCNKLVSYHWTKETTKSAKAARATRGSLNTNKQSAKHDNNLMKLWHNLEKLRVCQRHNAFVRMFFDVRNSATRVSVPRPPKPLFHVMMMAVAARVFGICEPSLTYGVSEVAEPAMAIAMFEEMCKDTWLTDSTTPPVCDFSLDSFHFDDGLKLFA